MGLVAVDVIIDAVIVSVEVSHYHFNRYVIVTFSDHDIEEGVTEELFGWYSDELHFHEDELLGLTQEQALRLRSRKDIAYLLTV